MSLKKFITTTDTSYFNQRLCLHVLIPSVQPRIRDLQAKCMHMHFGLTLDQLITEGYISPCIRDELTLSSRAYRSRVTSQTSSFLSSIILFFNSRLRRFEEGTQLYTQIGLAEKQSYAKLFLSLIKKENWYHQKQPNWSL